MDKAKRKQQPTNLKRYWLIFAVLALLLTIEFRIINNFGLPQIGLVQKIYGLIIVVVGFVLVRLIQRVGWKNPLMLVLIVCIGLAMFRIHIIQEHFGRCAIETRGLLNWPNEETTTSWLIFEPINCYSGREYKRDCMYPFFAIKGTPIVIYSIQYQGANTFCG